VAGSGGGTVSMGLTADFAVSFVRGPRGLSGGGALANSGARGGNGGSGGGGEVCPGLGSCWGLRSFGRGYGWFFLNLGNGVRCGKGCQGVESA